jgi:predicted metallopeptidase
MKPDSSSHLQKPKARYAAAMSSSARFTASAQPGRYAARAVQVGGQVVDLTTSLRHAAEEIVARVPELRHIDLERVHFAVFYSRHAKRILTYARCYPLPAGSRRRGRYTYRLEPILTEHGKRARYIVAFAWERFWGLSPRDRLETLVHELFHISPQFDGSLRQFGEKVHGRGRDWFDTIVYALSELYLPHGLELEYTALGLELKPGLEVTFDKLKPPRWIVEN